MICPACGKENDENYSECQFCGAVIAEKTSDANTDDTKSDDTSKSEIEENNIRKKPDLENEPENIDIIENIPMRAKRSRKSFYIALAISAIAALSVICAGYFVFFTDNGVENKENSTLSSGIDSALSSDVIPVETPKPDVIVPAADANYRSGYYLCGSTLYYYDIYADKSYSIANNITPDSVWNYDSKWVYITKDRSKLFFLESAGTDQGCTLKALNLKTETPSSEVIDTDVIYGCYLFDESGYFVYAKSDGIYELNIKDFSKQLAITPSYMGRGFGAGYMGSDTYAVKSADGVLYKKEFGKEAVEIASGVNSFYVIESSGNIVYEQVSDFRVKYKDYVEFDVSADDENYNEELVSELEQEYVFQNVNKILLYNGNESVILAQTGEICGHNDSGFVFASFEIAPSHKMKLSEIYNLYFLDDFIENSNKKAVFGMYSGGQIVNSASLENVMNPFVTSDLKTVYFLCNCNYDLETADIYKIEFDGSAFTDAQVVDTAVSMNTPYLHYDKLIYYKYSENDSVYLEGKKIAEDVWNFASHPCGNYAYVVNNPDQSADGNYSVIKANIAGSDVEVASVDNCTKIGFTYDGSLLCFYNESGGDFICIYYPSGQKETIPVAGVGRYVTVESVESDGQNELYSILFIKDNALYTIKDKTTKEVSKNVENVWISPSGLAQ